MGITFAASELKKSEYNRSGKEANSDESENTEVLEQMKIIGDLAPCGIGLYDLETSEPIFLNKAYYKLIGYTEEEYQPIKTDFDALMFPQDTPVTRQSKFVFDQEGEATGCNTGSYRKHWPNPMGEAECFQG